MRKSKLTIAAFTTCITVVTPPIVTSASCGTTTANTIEIKTNPNIKIECKEITVGNQLTIKYTLDSGYGFDIEKSTITFADNSVVWLLECKIDRENNIITVPAKYVTSKKVKIDIKAEGSEAATLDEVGYNYALASIINYADGRCYKIDGTGVIKYTDPSGKETSPINMNINIDASGRRDYFCERIQGVEEPVVQCWAEKAENVGAWQYEKTYEMKEIIKTPATRSYASAFLSTLLLNTFPGYRKLSYDTLFNAYYHEWKVGSQDWAVALKFNTNQKLTSFAYTFSEEDKTYHTTNAVTFVFEVDYSVPTISIPTEFKLKTDMLYEDANEYKFVNNQLECATHNDTIFGRFEIPLNKFTNFDKTKNLVLKLDHNVNVSGCEVDLTINNLLIWSKWYTFDDTKYILTIKKEAFDSLDTVEKLNAIIVNPSSDDATYQEKPTKFIICQEVVVKEVTLTPDATSFEELGISLKNYNSQKITNKGGGTSIASWELKDDVTIKTEQRYILEIETSSGTMEKTITLAKDATTFNVEFTEAEWVKLTNGASIKIEPDYIDKTCPIIPQTSFTDNFEVVEINPNVVVENGDRQILVSITVNKKPGHKAGKASFVLKSNPSYVVSSSDVSESIAAKYTFTLSVNDSGEQWLKIPYDDQLLLKYEIK